MDWLEFLSKSEWPLVASGTVILFRKQLRALFSQISPIKLDAWGLKAEFERKLETVESLSSDKDRIAEFQYDPLNQVGQDDGATKDDSKIWAKHHLARYVSSPETAIIKGWESFERGIQTRAMMAKVDVTARRMGEPLLRQLGVSDNEINIFRDLRSLRNRIAYADGPTAITWEEATRFVDAVAYLGDAVGKALAERKG